MKPIFLEIVLQVPEEQRELVIAALYGLDYEAFWETEEGVTAYVDQNVYLAETLREALETFGLTNDVITSQRECEDINWNKAWEEHFTEVEISPEILVRASFHTPQKDYSYEIIVDPQMSFGTGHHATTSMVLQFQLELDHHDQNVLDVGCGTGILSIMAEKRGASSINACDIDQWASGNSERNFELNNCTKCEVHQGTITEIPHQHSKYGIILANINKNVLMKDMELLRNYLAENGYLVLSGFYEEDKKDLIQHAKNVGLSVVDSKAQDRWASLLLTT